MLRTSEPTTFGGSILKSAGAILGLFLALAGSGCNGEVLEDLFVIKFELWNAGNLPADSFQQDEIIKPILQITNQSKSSRTLTFPTSQKYEFVVKRQGDDPPLWHWSVGKDFPGVTSEPFLPNETKLYSVNWDQKDDNGGSSGPGSYEARGIICQGDPCTTDVVPAQFQSTLIPFTIKPWFQTGPPSPQRGGRPVRDQVTRPE